MDLEHGRLVRAVGAKERLDREWQYQFHFEVQKRDHGSTDQQLLNLLVHLITRS